MNYSTDSRDKLYSIFMDRYMELSLLLATDYQPNHVFCPQWGHGFSPEECSKIERTWENYLSGMGCSVQGWAKAMGHEGVVIRNPCEMSTKFHANNPSITTYILMTEELATKILVLGGLP